MGKSGFRYLAVISAASGAALVGGCSSTGVEQPSSTSPGGSSIETLANDSSVGSVSMRLDLAPGASVTSLQWTIRNGTNSYAGTTAIGDAQSAEFVAGGILAGSGYTVTVNATDSRGDSCTGTSAPFGVIAGAVTQTALNVACTAATDATIAADVNSGTLEVDAAVNLVKGPGIPCPGISSFSISPAEINPSQTAALTLATIGPTSAVMWTVSPASGGTFGNPDAATTTFACASGPAFVPQVTVTATVGLPDSGACAGQPYTSMSGLINCEPLCTTAASCPASTTACQIPTCVADACGFTNAPEGSACSDGGGTVCNGVGSCVPFTFEVARVGSGTGSITANTTAVFIEQRRIADGSLVATLPMPTSANPDGGVAQPITTTGTSITEADLTRSVDGRYVTLAGYAAPPGTSAPTNSTTLPRVIARVDASGHVDTSTVLTFSVGSDVIFGGGNPRTAVSLDGSEFWVSGTGTTSGSTSMGGLWYVPFGPAAGSISVANQLTASAIRAARVFGGQLYADSESATMTGVSMVGSGTPTTGPQIATELPGLPPVTSAGLWSFALLDLNPSVPGVDTLYLASSTVITLPSDGGTLPMGILKYAWNGTTWSFVESFGPSGGVRSLAAMATPGSSTVTLVASNLPGTGSTSNVVQVFVDDGTSIATGPSVSSATNTLYRGAAFTPHP